jgi:putative ABC transport system substrate-binding protein
MRRREFIGLLGGVGVPLFRPLAALAQQAAPAVIGVLSGQSANSYARQVAALRKGLGENGYVEGQNLLIEYRWADGHDDRLPDFAADLVRRGVEVIVCGGSPGATPAAKAATSTIPIVFSTGTDPVKAGYVESLNRPGGNVTGAAFLATQLGAKRLGLLHQLLPNVTTIAALFNRNHPNTASDLNNVENAARSMGLQLHILFASTESEIDAAFAALAGVKASALLVGPDPVFLSNRHKIVALAASYAVPAAYELREFVDDGGLMSYGTSITEANYQAGLYIARILKGEKPGDLPVIQSTKFEFVINLKAAKTLGLTVPPTLIATADEVIE